MECDGKPGALGWWVERAILTRRRGGAEEDAEEEREQARRGKAMLVAW